MATKIEKDKMRDFLKRLPSHIRDNVEVIETDTKFPYSLHISANKNIRSFTPMVSKRGLDNEDRTVPRVCVSASLWGCLVGYSSVAFDFDGNDSEGWLGGYVIYGLPNRLRLKPGKKLLSDADHTDEEWLVGFDNNHLEIKPTKLGKCFAYSINTSCNGEDKRQYDITLYLEVGSQLNQPFPVLPDLSVESGYWRIEVTGVESKVYWDRSKITVHSITKEEYASKKNLSAGLLSFEGLPPSIQW